MDKMMSFEEERQYLAKKRILFALAKSLSIGGLCFSMSMFLTCIVFAYENLAMDPVMILKTWITFFVLTIYTFIRIWVGQGALRKRQVEGACALCGAVPMHVFN